MKKFWIVNKIDNNTAEILMYGYIGIDDVCASDFVAELKALEKDYTKINVRINSGGGSVFEGFAIFNALRNCKSLIETYIDGLAASMGTVIALAGRQVHMSKNARFMTHRASGFAIGSADDMRQNAELLEGLEKTICGIYASKTGKTVDECKTKYLGSQDRWFTADQALTEKLIDSIYDSEPVDLSKNVTDERAIWNAYSNKFSNTFQNQNNNMKKFSISASLLALLKLTDSVDDAALETAINALINQANKVDAAEAAKKKAEDDLVQFKTDAGKAKIENLVTTAIAEKKITIELGNQLKLDYATNADGLEKMLKAMPAYKSITTELKVDEATELGKLSWEQLDKAGKLDDLKAKNIELFKQKYKDAFNKEYTA